MKTARTTADDGVVSLLPPKRPPGSGRKRRAAEDGIDSLSTPPSIETKTDEKETNTRKAKRPVVVVEDVEDDI